MIVGEQGRVVCGRSADSRSSSAHHYHLLFSAVSQYHLFLCQLKVVVCTSLSPSLLCCLSVLSFFLPTQGHRLRITITSPAVYQSYQFCRPKDVSASASLSLSLPCISLISSAPTTPSIFGVRQGDRRKFTAFTGRGFASSPLRLKLITHPPRYSPAGIFTPLLRPALSLE